MYVLWRRRNGPESRFGRGGEGERGMRGGGGGGGEGGWYDGMRQSRTRSTTMYVIKPVIGCDRRAAAAVLLAGAPTIRIISMLYRFVLTQCINRSINYVIKVTRGARCTAILCACRCNEARRERRYENFKPSPVYRHY